jgi:hypothetical protein
MCATLNRPSMGPSFFFGLLARLNTKGNKQNHAISKTE